MIHSQISFINSPLAVSHVSLENLVLDEPIIPEFKCFLSSHYFPAWYYINIVRRNSVFITHVHMFKSFLWLFWIHNWAIKIKQWFTVFRISQFKIDLKMSNIGKYRNKWASFWRNCGAPSVGVSQDNLVLSTELIT